MIIKSNPHIYVENKFILSLLYNTHSAQEYQEHYHPPSINLANKTTAAYFSELPMCSPWICTFNAAVKAFSYIQLVVSWLATGGLPIM